MGGIGQNSLIAIARCTPAAAQQHTACSACTAPPLAMCFRCIARSLAQLEAEQKQTSLIVIGEAEMKLRALNWEETQLGRELNSSRERLLKVGEEGGKGQLWGKRSKFVS